MNGEARALRMSGRPATCRRALLLASSLVLCGGGCTLVGAHAYLRAKAAVAAVLIDRAYAAHIVDGRVHRPWGWADMHPVAMLEVPRLGVRRAILSAASGSALAFGLGHVDGTADPGGPGNCAIAGHRDTWAAFLRELRPDDELRLLTRAGSRRFLVDRLEVVSKDDLEALEPAAGTRLTLITCYPFGALFRGRLRYVVVCRPA